MGHRLRLRQPIVTAAAAVFVFVIAFALLGLPVHAVTDTLFGTQTPTQAAANDSGAVEVGLKFQSSVAGQVAGIRFYKGNGNSGSHVGNLWSSSGTKLATGTFTNETVTGWQTLTFPTAIPIQPNTTYVASYFAPRGHYAATNFGLNNAITSGPLTALASGTSSGNGVYKYSSASTFPNQTYQASNYWVDVNFTPNTMPPDTTPPTTTITAPTNGATVSGATTVTAT